MRQTTINKLLELNRQMYLETADSFDATRQKAWFGWQKVAELMPRTLKPRAVLDVGCGNGRFGVFLLKQLGGNWHYTGIDSSEALVNKARTALDGQVATRWIVAEVLANDPVEVFGDSVFDLIAVFGLMHHLPTFNLRTRLLGQLVKQLKPGGLLAVSFWQPLNHQRFMNKIVPWETAGITPREAEPGDVLITFGGTKQLRYCHHFDNGEVDKMKALIPAATAADYFADGITADLNRYVVWQLPG
jgi:SAM-dependent methyltransferase